MLLEQAEFCRLKGYLEVAANLTSASLLLRYEADNESTELVPEIKL